MEENMEIDNCIMDDDDFLMVFDPDEAVIQHDVNEVLEEMITAVEEEQASEDQLKELIAVIDQMEELERRQKFNPNFVKINEINEIPIRKEKESSFITFIATVIDVKIEKADIWVHLADESNKVIGIMIRKTDQGTEDAYPKLLKEFKRVKAEKEKSFLLDVSAAEWLLARRQKYVRTLNSINYLNSEVIIIGKVGEYKSQKCVFVKKMVPCEEKVKAWFLKNMAIGRREVIRHEQPY